MSLQAAMARRQKVLAFIREKQIDIDIPLPVIDTNRCKIKTPGQIGNRIMQLYALIGLTDPEVIKDKVYKWLISNELFDTLEEEEKSLFVYNIEVKKRSTISLSWCP